MIANRYSPILRREENIGLTLLRGGLKDSVDSTLESIEPFLCELESVVPYSCSLEITPFLGRSYCTAYTSRTRPLYHSALEMEERGPLRRPARSKIIFMFDKRVTQ